MAASTIEATLEIMSIDLERWKRIEETYHRVVAYPPDQRASILEESFPGDAALREEVESLLKAREAAGAFLSPDDLKDHIADLGTAPALASVLGPYEILSPLGAGGMGDVYRARDTRLQREVALKILHSHLHDAARVSRFQLEAKAASALNHPNIATIFDIGEEKGIWFIAAELVEGTNLRERMAGGKLPVDEAIQITMQCAAALDVAHRAGIVHRDIKPENVMLRPDGVVKVVDFGLARITLTGQEPSTDLSQSGAVMGTPRYMSPEQARGLKPDARSDIFSLGAVLYEMVAGRPAFPGSTAPEVFAALLDAEPPPPAGSVLDYILGKALQKDREQRYQTMQEFANDLRDVDPTGRHTPWTLLAAHLPGPALAGRRGLWLLAMAAVAGLIWAASRVVSHPSSQQALNVVALTTFGGSKDHPVFSPDGSRLVFSWRPSHKSARHIYVKTVGPGEPVQLTNTVEDDDLPIWSPDGRQIAFCRYPVESGYDSRQRRPSAIYVIPSEGGKERKIAQAAAGVSWSADGRTLAVARVPDNAADSGGIDLLSLESGERRKLTAFQEDILPVFSPNGKWIAFTRALPGRGREIFVVPAAGGPARQLTFDGHQTNGATWTGDSSEIVFSSPRNRAQGELWRIPLKGGVPQPVGAALRNASSPYFSPLAARLAFTESWTDSNIHLRSGSGFAGTALPGRFGQPAAVIASTRADHSPAFSPDGERVAFATNRSANEEIWISRRDGSEAVPLTAFGNDSAGSPRWSPDGQQIAFDVWASGESNVYIVNARGGAPRRLSSDGGESWMPAWSHDGAWIYFTSRRSGTREIWKMPAAGGAATRVTYSGAYEARPSPDGKTIYFSKTTDAGCCAIWSLPVAGGPEQPVRELENFSPISRSWGVLERGIYFLSKRNEPPHTVRFLSFATHQVADIARLEKEPGWIFPALAMSVDGRHLLTVQIDREVNDLMMIENFH